MRLADTAEREVPVRRARQRHRRERVRPHVQRGTLRQQRRAIRPDLALIPQRHRRTGDRLDFREPTDQVRVAIRHEVLDATQRVVARLVQRARQAAPAVRLERHARARLDQHARAVESREAQPAQNLLAAEPHAEQIAVVLRVRDDRVEVVLAARPREVAIEVRARAQRGRRAQAGHAQTPRREVDVLYERESVLHRQGSVEDARQTGRAENGLATKLEGAVRQRHHAVGRRGVSHDRTDLDVPRRRHRGGTYALR